MTDGMSARSLLTAGVSLAAVGSVAAAVAVTPLPAPGRSTIPLVVAAPTVQLSAVTSAGDFVKTAYDTVEPWVAYGFELADYALSYVPVLWWVAPAVDLAYFTIEPLVQAAVYSFADLIDLNFAQIGPDIQAGIAEATQNFLDYSAQWIADLIPFPPLPPIPPLPGASAGGGGVTAAVRANPAAALPAPAQVTESARTSVSAVETPFAIDPPESSADANTGPARTPIAGATETAAPALRAKRNLTGRADRAATVPSAAGAGQSAGTDRDGVGADDSRTGTGRPSARTR